MLPQLTLLVVEGRITDVSMDPAHLDALKATAFLVLLPLILLLANDRKD